MIVARKPDAVTSRPNTIADAAQRRGTNPIRESRFSRNRMLEAEGSRPAFIVVSNHCCVNQPRVL